MDYWPSEEAWKLVVSSVARGGEEGNAAAQALRRALDDDNTSQDQRRVIGSAAFNWWMNSSTDQINNAPVFLLRLARDEALLRKNSDAARDLDAVVRGKFPPGVLNSDDAPLDPKRPILQEEMHQATSVLCRRGVAVDQGVGSYAAPIVVYAIEGDELKNQLSRELNNLTEVRPLIINLNGHYIGGFARPTGGGSVSVKLLDTQPNPEYLKNVTSVMEGLGYEGSILKRRLQEDHAHLAQACGALTMLMLEHCMAQPDEAFPEDRMEAFVDDFLDLSEETQASCVNNMRSDLLQQLADASHAMFSVDEGRQTAPQSTVVPHSDEKQPGLDMVVKELPEKQITYSEQVLNAIHRVNRSHVFHVPPEDEAIRAAFRNFSFTDEDVRYLTQVLDSATTWEEIVNRVESDYVFNTDPLRGEELWKMQQELATGDYGLICGALLRRPEDFLDDLDEGAAFLKHVSELACLKSYPACLGEVKRKAGVLESLCGQRKTEFTGGDVYTALVQGDAATLQNLNKNIARLTKGGNTEIDPEKMRNWVFGSDVMSHSSAIFAMLQDASKNCGKKDMKPAFLGYLELVDAVAKKFDSKTRGYWLEGFKLFEKSPQFESFKKVLGSDFAKRYKPLMAALASSVFR